MAVALSFVIPVESVFATSDFELSGTGHVQNMGDVKGTYESDVLSIGTSGKSLRLEGFQIDFENKTELSGKLQYRVHIQNKGWTDWMDAGTYAGSKGEGLRVEGVQMRLTEELGEAYDVVYRAHIQGYGNSQGWVKNGRIAGTVGESKRVENISVKITEKTGDTGAFLSYRTHIQNNGWEVVWRDDGQVSGTTGESKRLEAINITVTGTDIEGSVEYRTHVQNIGWQDWVEDGAMAGTSGRSLRLEAIQIRLTGDLADAYDIYYRVHAQNYGWLSWTKNGEKSGTAGGGLRLEAIQIVLVDKGGDAPGDVGGIKSVSDKSFVEIQNGFVTVGDDTYYYRLGTKATGWVTTGGNKYYFGSDGKMVKGARTIGDGVYYFDESTGVMRKSGQFTASDGTKYILRSDGKQYKILVDAGHYGYKYNQSPSVPAYYESVMTWKLHLYLKEELEERGFAVKTLRSSIETVMEPYDRGIGSAGCDLFLFLHSDASSNYNADFATAYCSINGSADEIGELLVNAVSDTIGTKQSPKVLHKRDTENSSLDYWKSLKGATKVGTPGILLEHSFHTNVRVANWLLKDSNLAKLAKAEADVMEAYYSSK